MWYTHQNTICWERYVVELRTSKRDCRVWVSHVPYRLGHLTGLVIPHSNFALQLKVTLPPFYFVPWRPPSTIIQNGAFIVLPYRLLRCRTALTNLSANSTGSRSIHRWQEAEEEVVQGQGYVNESCCIQVVCRDSRVVVEEYFIFKIDYHGGWDTGTQ